MRIVAMNRTGLACILGAAALATMSAAPALAHNLILEAYAVGGGKSIEGDAFFSDGTLVKGAKIMVTDDAGKVLREVTTDDKGSFAYTPSAAVSQHLTLDVGAGHVAKVVIAAAKLGSGSPAASAPVVAQATPAPTAPAKFDAAAADRIARMVAAEIEPLVTEVETYKSHNDQMNLLAAIGLLSGFAGVLLFSAGAALVKSGGRQSSVAAGRPGARN